MSSAMVPAFAKDSISTKRVELSAIRSKIRAVDINLGHLQAAQRSTQEKLAELDIKIGKYALILKELQAEIDKTTKAMEDTEKQMLVQQSLVDEQKKILKSQVVAAYRAGQGSRLKLLLNQRDPALSGRMMVYYDYLNKKRLQTAAQYEQGIRQLALLKQKQQLDSVLLSDDLDAKQVEQAQLADAKRARLVVLGRLRKQVSNDKNQLGLLKQNERTLKDLLGRLQHQAELALRDNVPKLAQEKESGVKHGKVMEGKSVSDKNALRIGASVANFDSSYAGKSFSQLKGRLVSPVAGKVNRSVSVEQFGNGREGVLIEAAEGNAVRTVASGKIAYAGWLRGYGLLTIVNHGGGYMTVYAFSQSLYKKVGDSVKAGDIIATIGQSGGQAKVGLYFEIRRRGQPLNPTSWFKK